MVIEMNKDIEKYQESVVWGLTVKQLLFSAVSSFSDSPSHYVPVTGKAKSD